MTKFDYKTMRKLICLFIAMTSMQLSRCTIENKAPATNTSIPNSFSCGKYVSRVYPRDPKTEIYPDLGMVLSEKKLQLTPTQIEKLKKAAADCALRCQIRKDEINLLTQKLHLSLTKKEYLSGNLSRLAYQLHKIEEQKEKWLALHHARYTLGLNLLDEKQLQIWEKIVKNRASTSP